MQLLSACTDSLPFCPDGCHRAHVRRQFGKETRLVSGLQGEREVQQRAQHVQAAVAYHLLTSYYEREPAALDWLSKLEVALFQAGSLQPGSAGPELPGQVQSSEQATAAHIAAGQCCCSAPSYVCCQGRKWPCCCSAACHSCCQGRTLRCRAWAAGSDWRLCQ